MSLHYLPFQPRRRNYRIGLSTSQVQLTAPIFMWWNQPLDKQKCRLVIGLFERCSGFHNWLQPSSAIQKRFGGWLCCWCYGDAMNRVSTGVGRFWEQCRLLSTYPPVETSIYRVSKSSLFKQQHPRHHPMAKRFAFVFALGNGNA